jgi:hypothetical protein
MSYYGLVVLGTDNKTIYKLSPTGVPATAGTLNYTTGITFSSLAYDPGARASNTATYWTLGSDGRLFKLIFGPSQYQISAAPIGKANPFPAGASNFGLVDVAGTLYTIYQTTVNARQQCHVQPIDKIGGQLGAQPSTSFGYGSGGFGLSPSGNSTGIAYDPTYSQFYMCDPTGSWVWPWVVPGWTALWGYTPTWALLYANYFPVDPNLVTIQTGPPDTLWVLDTFNNYLSFTPTPASVGQGNAGPYILTCNVTAASVAAYTSMAYGWIPW